MTNQIAKGSKSLVLHSAARYYDRLAWLLTLGREDALRKRLVEIARLAPGETVLDVGCGTGSLALAAKRRVDAGGAVRGVDASPEMVERARVKASKAGLDIHFEVGRGESLPLADRSVDVVLSSLMLHHLPQSVREAFAGEIRRVLRPGGRVLAVDFEPPAQRRGGLISRVHRHGHVPLHEIVNTLGRAGLHVTETGSVGLSDLWFALATLPADGNDAADLPAPVHRSLPRLPVPRWMLPAAAAVILAAHVLVVRAVSSVLALGTVAAVGLAAVVALRHVGRRGGSVASASQHERVR